VTSDALRLAELVAHDLMRDDAQAWLADGFRRWLRAGGSISLQRALRLPATVASLRRALRDRHLAEAFDALPAGLTAWQRARVLAEAAREFERRKWPLWRRHTAAPAEATRVEVALFYALKCGARLPATAQAFATLAKKIDAETSRRSAHDCRDVSRTRNAPCLATESPTSTPSASRASSSRGRRCTTTSAA
jgi:hypothetical protein